MGVASFCSELMTSENSGGNSSGSAESIWPTFIDAPLSSLKTLTTRPAFLIWERFRSSSRCWASPGRMLPNFETMEDAATRAPIDPSLNMRLKRFELTASPVSPANFSQSSLMATSPKDAAGKVVLARLAKVKAVFEAINSGRVWALIPRHSCFPNMCLGFDLPGQPWGDTRRKFLPPIDDNRPPWRRGKRCPIINPTRFVIFLTIRNSHRSSTTRNFNLARAFGIPRCARAPAAGGTGVMSDYLKSKIRARNAAAPARCASEGATTRSARQGRVELAYLSVATLRCRNDSRPHGFPRGLENRS